MLGVALHPTVVGQPHRALHLEPALTRLREADDPFICWTTGGAVADHYLDVAPGG